MTLIINDLTVQISWTSQKIKIMFHVFLVASRFARCFAHKLSIEEVGIFSKCQSIYDDSHFSHSPFMEKEPGIFQRFMDSVKRNSSGIFQVPQTPNGESARNFSKSQSLCMCRSPEVKFRSIYDNLHLASLNASPTASS